MSIYLVFLSVITIWSTTPLAIVWSTLGSSASFALTSRMLLGLVICLLLLLIKRQKLTLTHKTIRHYLYAGSGIFITMELVYHAAQSLPSGMIAVIFGLTPIVTGVFALLLLKQAFFKVHKVLGLLLALGGLVVIFNHSLQLNTELVPGLVTVIMAMTFQAFISVKLKQLNVSVHALETTTGALIVSVPLFLISWLIFDIQLPNIGLEASLSILYLAMFGSVIGFMSYYHLIRHANVQVVGIVPLITPIFALILGATLNQESLTTQQLSGIILTLVGLSIYEYGKKIWNKK